MNRMLLTEYLQRIQDRLRSLRVNLAHKTLAEIETALGNEIARLGKVIGDLATEKVQVPE